MKKNAITHWPLWAVFLFVGSLGVITAISGHSSAVQAAGANIIGIQLTDNEQDTANCAHGDKNGPVGLANIGLWTPWVGDSPDQYDPDCARLYLGGPIPPDVDIQIGLQAQDINIPCGFLWTSKCGDGGGTIVYGPWMGDQGGVNANVWSGWATDADGWDPDVWRVIVNTRPWYGHTVNNWQVGLQAGDTSSGGGCTEQVGTTQYTLPSASGASYSTPWSSDNVDNQNFNCLRDNLIASASLNDPIATFTGTSTTRYGSSVNLPWDVEYIDTSAGCTLTAPGDTGRPRIKLNGTGSTTTIPITGTVTYTMVCPGFKGGTSVTATKTITTIAQPASLEFNIQTPPGGVTAGGTVTTTLSVVNGVQCTLVGKDLNGNVVDDGSGAGYPYNPPAPIVTRYIALNSGFITSGSGTWTVPSDFASFNYVEVYGGGGAGGGNYGAHGAGGGGGGGYAAGALTGYNPGNGISYYVGGGGGSSGAGGGYTYFGPLIGYGGGGGTYNSGGGAAGGGGGASGGSAANYGGGSGGNGAQSGSCGAYGCSGYWGGGGGGGAAGPGGGGGGGGSGEGSAYGTCCGNYGGAGAGGYAGAGGRGGDDNNYAYAGSGGAYGGGGGGAGDDSGCNDCGAGGGAGVQGLIQLSWYYFVPLYNTRNTTLTSGTSWKVPSDWNSANNSIELWGGGGGGGGDGVSPADGTSGTATTFNGALSAGGGIGGANGSSTSNGIPGGAGGAASGGNAGNSAGVSGSSGTQTTGGAGGASPNGGSGGATQNSASAGNPGSFPGGGGGGGGCGNGSCATDNGGAGGGGGAYVRSTNVALTPGSNVSYQIGHGGAGGTGDQAGGPGFDGKIYISYQSSTADDTDVHYGKHTVVGTTDYTASCQGQDGVWVSKTIRVSLPGCGLDGVTLTEGASSNFYSQKYPPTGHTCAEYGPVSRTCSAGALTGNSAYKYSSCTDQSAITLTANGKSPSASVRKGSNVALAWNGGNSNSCTLTSSTASQSVVKVFTSTQSWTVPAGVSSVKVLVVGGGGGGGTNMGGGGGGGGVVYDPAYPVQAGSTTLVTVGAGGAGAPAGLANGTHPSVPGNNGGNSVFGTLTAIGGGRGGVSYNTMGLGINTGAAGGSGGGASGYNNNGVSASGGAGTTGQGYRGGNQGVAYYSGGGGGAGGAGADGNNQANGGPGVLNSITGVPLYWGGGGGGSGYSICGGNGGIGGGGGAAVCATTGGAGLNNGSPGGGGVVNAQTNTPGGNGGANTGGGGGGGSHFDRTNKGGDGGSGVVIVSYDPVSGTSGGLSSTDVVGSRAIIADQKTIFTLSCSLASSTKQASVTVNLLPTIIEN